VKAMWVVAAGGIAVVAVGYGDGGKKWKVVVGKQTGVKLWWVVEEMKRVKHYETTLAG